jgi:hypothetical protein
VQATTLEQAAESLLATPEAPEASGDNLSEAVELITEPSDDGQGDEVEETTESDDGVEASDGIDDAEIDGDEVVAEAEDTNLISVKVDGKEENWTLDQLKQSAAGQAAINKRFQEAAEARKQIEQQAAALAQQQQQVLDLYQQAQQQGVQVPIPPSRELFDSDPIGYMEEKMKYDEAKEQYDNQVLQLQQIHDQKTQQQAQARHSYLQQQAEILKQHIPEIGDPEKGQKLKNDLVQVGLHYGFTSDEMAGVSDARYVRALNDALKYRRLVEKRNNTQQKGEKARPVVKAGSRKVSDGQSATRKKARQRLQKTGSIKDAVGLILDN